MNLALFDFDGTLTTKDSLGEFLKFCVNKPTYYFKLLLFSPFFVLYKLKLMKNDKAKEILFCIFFKDTTKTEFQKLATTFSQTQLDKILNKTTYEILKKHKQNGDKIIVVSASMRCWLEPWCKKQNIELLCTELNFKDEKFTCSFKTKNCHGQEKVNRIKHYINIDNFDEIYAYGDSSGDTQMLQLADFGFMVKKDEVVKV